MMIKRRSKQVVAGVSALAMMAQMGFTAFADLIVKEDTIVDNTGNYVSADSDLFKDATPEDLEALINAWGTPKDPKFAVVEGDYNSVVFTRADSSEEIKRVLTWSTPDIDNLDNLTIKTKYWLNPTQRWNFTEDEIIQAHSDVQNYLWGADGKSGVLYSLMLDYDDIVNTIAEDYEVLYEVYKDTTGNDVIRTKEYLEVYKTEIDAYNSVNKGSDGLISTVMFNPFYAYKIVADKDGRYADYIEKHLKNNVPSDSDIKIIQEHHKDWASDVSNVEYSSNSKSANLSYNYVEFSDVLSVFCDEYMSAVSKMEPYIYLIDDYTKLKESNETKDLAYKDFILYELESKSLDTVINDFRALVDAYADINELNAFYIDENINFLIDDYSAKYDAFQFLDMQMSMYTLFHTCGEYHYYAPTGADVDASNSSSNNYTNVNDIYNKFTTTQPSNYVKKVYCGTNMNTGSKPVAYVDEYGRTIDFSSFPKYSTLKANNKLERYIERVPDIGGVRLYIITVTTSTSSSSSSTSSTSSTSYSYYTTSTTKDALKYPDFDETGTSESTYTSTGSDGSTVEVKTTVTKSFAGTYYWKNNSDSNPLFYDYVYKIMPPMNLCRAFVMMSKMTLAPDKRGEAPDQSTNSIIRNNSSSVENSNANNVINNTTNNAIYSIANSTANDGLVIQNGVGAPSTITVPSSSSSSVSSVEAIKNNVYLPPEYTDNQSPNMSSLDAMTTMSWYIEDDNAFSESSPINKYNKRVFDLIYEINHYTDARALIINTLFEDASNLSSLWEMADLSVYLDLKPLKSRMLTGAWDFNGTSEVVQKQIASLERGVYEDGTEYEYTAYTPAVDDAGNPIYYASQFEATPWVTYSSIFEDTSGIYASDYLRNELGKVPSITGNPTHPEKHAVTTSDILTLHELGYNSNELEAGVSSFKLESVDINVSRELVGYGDDTSGNASTYAITLTDSDMYNIDLKNIINTIRDKEYATVPSSAIDDLKEACKAAGYTDSRIAEIIESYYGVTTGWNDGSKYKITIDYNYELPVSITNYDANFSISNLEDNTLYVIPEYSISEYYDSINDSFTSSNMIKYFDGDVDFGSVVSGLTPNTKAQTEPVIMSYSGAASISWYSQLHRVGINNLNKYGKMVSGSIKTENLNSANISVPAENINANNEAIPGTYLRANGQEYAIIGCSSGKVSYDTRYFVLACDSETKPIYTIGSKEIDIDPTHYVNYSEYIKEIAKGYQPVSGGITSGTLVASGAISEYAPKINASALGESDETILKFTPTVGNTKIFYAIQEASGKVSSTQIVRRISRMLYPIVQYTVNTEDYYNTDYNLNNHLYAVYGKATINSNNQITDESGSTDSAVVTKGNNKIGVDAGAIRAFVTEACIPQLIWDSNGNIKNKYNGKLDNRFDIDLHLWLSKNTAEDGIYVADWINDVPTIFNVNGVFKNVPNGSLLNSTDATHHTSVFKPSHIAYAQDGSGNSALKRSIILQSTPTEGTFSDWMFGKTTGRMSVTYYCENCHQFITDIEEHALDWSNVIHTQITTAKTTHIETKPCHGEATTRDGSSFSLSTAAIRVPSVMCSGPFYKVGFWNIDYLDPTKANNINFGDEKFEWYVSKNYSRDVSVPDNSGLDWGYDQNGNINITGTDPSGSGYSGGYTAPKETDEELFKARLEKAKSEAAAALERHPGAYVRTLETDDGVLIYLDEIPVGSQYDYWNTHETYDKTSYWKGLKDGEGVIEDDTRMGYSATITEPYGIYHYLPKYRLGGSMNAMLVDPYGGFTVTQWGSSDDLWDMFGSGFSVSQKNIAGSNMNMSGSGEYTDANAINYKDRYENMKNSYDVMSKLNRGGIELINVNNVSGYVCTANTLFVTRSTGTMYFTSADKTLAENWNSSYHNELAGITSLSGDGYPLSPEPYTPPTDSIQFHIDITSSNPSGGMNTTLGSNNTTTEQLLDDGTLVITTKSVTEGSDEDGQHICSVETVIVLTLNIQRSGPGPEPYMPKIQAAMEICKASDTGEFALTSIDAADPPAQNGSMIAPTYDNKYYDRAGVLISEDAGAYWYTDPTGEKHYIGNTNVHTIEVWTDNVTYYPMTFVKNIRSDNATPLSTKYIQESEAIRITKKVTSPDEELGDHTWQTDIVDYTMGTLNTQRTYNIVPEVLMTYKTDFAGNTTAANAANRGKLGSVYIAAYNEYEMTFPAYHNVKLNMAVEDITANASAVASSKNATELSKKKGDLPVWYTGTDATVTFNIDDNNNHIEWNSYVLDFVDSAKSLKIAKTWNPTYKEDDAVKLVNSYLDSFKNSDGTSFVATGIMTNTYATLDKDEGGDNDIIAKAKTQDITMEDEFEFDSIDGTNTYEELESIPIVIRNARLAQIICGAENEGTTVTFNFPTDIDATSEALMQTDTFKDLNNKFPDIAEAIINMKLAEFAGTWVHNGGSESWDKYDAMEIGKGNVDGDSISVGEYVFNNKIHSDSSFNASNNWYSEDSTVLRIRVFKQEAVLPDMFMFTWKIPVDYGYSSPINKADTFKYTSGETGIYGYCEFGLRFKNTWKSTVEGEEDLNSAGWDILGNEYTDVSKCTVDPLFVIHNGNVNDMYS